MAASAAGVVCKAPRQLLACWLAMPCKPLLALPCRAAPAPGACTISTVPLLLLPVPTARLQPNAQAVVPEDLRPLLAGILLSHPGLEFLQEAPEFQER